MNFILFLIFRFLSLSLVSWQGKLRFNPKAAWRLPSPFDIWPTQPFRPPFRPPPPGRVLRAWVTFKRQQEEKPQQNGKDSCTHFTLKTLKKKNARSIFTWERLGKKWKVFNGLDSRFAVSVFFLLTRMRDFCGTAARSFNGF